MQEKSDLELLQDYHRQGSEAAFAGLVRRHINLVYSAALRQVGIAAQAEEITQVVFIILARKASGLRPGIILEAWLYETTRLTSLNFLRGERRRQRREQEVYMQSILQESTDPSTWRQLAPLLDEAMAQLGKADRAAVILRFFKEKNLAEVAAALNVTEAAAQSRVHRALKKLHRFFNKHGVTSTTGIIAQELSANSIHAAPAVLAKSVTTMAITKGVTASGSTLSLIKSTGKIMIWSKLKAAVVIGVGILLASGAAIVAVNTLRPSVPTPAKVWDLYAQAFAQSTNGSQATEAAVRVMTHYPPMALIRLSPVQRPGRMWFDDAGRTEGVGRPEGHVEMGAFLGEVLRYVYGLDPDFPQNRIIVSEDLLESRYDFVDTMPQGGKEILQRALKDQFGLVARRELHTNLVLMVVNPSATGLHRHVSGLDEFRSRNITMAMVANGLSEQLGVKVTDETGLAGGFDYSLDLPNPATPDDIKKAVEGQLGLGLVPTTDNQTIEFLVVEKMH